MNQESHSRTMASLEKQIGDAKENLHLIDERIAKYFHETDVPLQYLKEE